jgi:hypothetical protein
MIDDPATQLVPNRADIARARASTVRKYAAALGLDRGYSAHSMRATCIPTALEYVRHPPRDPRIGPQDRPSGEGSRANAFSVTLDSCFRGNDDAIGRERDAAPSPHVPGRTGGIVPKTWRGLLPLRCRESGAGRWSPRRRAVRAPPPPPAAPRGQKPADLPWRAAQIRSTCERTARQMPGFPRRSPAAGSCGAFLCYGTCQSSRVSNDPSRSDSWDGCSTIISPGKVVSPRRP